MGDLEEMEEQADSCHLGPRRFTLIWMVSNTVFPDSQRMLWQVLMEGLLPVASCMIGFHPLHYSPLTHGQ